MDQVWSATSGHLAMQTELGREGGSEGGGDRELFTAFLSSWRALVTFHCYQGNKWGVSGCTNGRVSGRANGRVSGCVVATVTCG